MERVASTNSINQNTAKASLTQMINIVFSKMEAYSGNFGTQLKKLQMRHTAIAKSRSTLEEDSISNKHSDKSGGTGNARNRAVSYASSAF